MFLTLRLTQFSSNLALSLCSLWYLISSLL